MTPFFQGTGPRRAVIGVALIVFSVAVASVMVRKASEPAVEYDFLQDHLELTLTPLTDQWEPAVEINTRGRSLSKTDITFMSRILTVSEAGQKFWAGEIVVEAQALKTVEKLQTDKILCENGIAPCLISVRVDRILTPRQVHGDLRVVNIQERSRRIDLSAEPSESVDGYSFKVIGGASEVRNLRFAKRRNGWVLRTMDVLETNPTSNISTAKIPTEKFAGINYYPATSSWRAFWTEFPEAQIKKDFAQIRGLGGNAIRIFLTHSTFSDFETKQVAQQRLVSVMDMAHAQGLKVMPTVFDLRPDYRVENWASDVAYLKDLLPVIQNHPALLALDLKNQIDLDIPLYGEGLVTGWIAVMLDAVRSNFPQIPITVGFSKAAPAIQYGQNLDVISYHDYDPIKGFQSRLKAVRAAYPDRPVWMTEVGSSAWSPIPNKSRREKAQAKRLSYQLDNAYALDGVFLWTLTDFDHVGSDVVGWQPWRKLQQAHYGMFDLEGRARANAQVFIDFAAALTTVSGHRQASALKLQSSQTPK